MGLNIKMTRRSIDAPFQTGICLLAMVLIAGCSSSARRQAQPTGAPVPVSSTEVAEPAEIRSLDLQKEGRAALLQIVADRSLVWTNYRDQNGDLVVELQNSVPGAGIAELSPMEGLVAGVDVTLLDDAERPLTRLVVKTREDSEYTLTTEGEILRLQLLPLGYEEPVALAYEPLASEDLDETRRQAAAPPHTNGRSYGTAESPLAGVAPQGVAASRLQNVDVLNAGDSTVVQIVGDGEFSYSSFRLQNPERFVIDLSGVVNTSSRPSLDVGTGTVEQIRVGQFKPRPDAVSRVVFDLNDFALPTIEQTADGLVVTFESGQAQVVQKGLDPPAMEAPVEPSMEEAPMEVAEAETIDEPYTDPIAEEPMQSAEMQSDEMTAAEEMQAEEIQAEEIQAEPTQAEPTRIADAEMPSQSPEPPVPTSPAEEPKMEEPMYDEPMDDAMEAETEEVVTEEPLVAEWEAPPPPAPTPAAPVPVYEPSEETLTMAESTAGAMDPPPARQPVQTGDVAMFETQNVSVPQARSQRGDVTIPAFPTLQVNRLDQEYAGEAISMSLKDADLVETLRSFAKISDLNFVIQPGVGGTVTVELKGVPWDQAMEQILKINNLGMEIDGSIVRIAPASQLAAEAEEQRRLEQARIEAIPLRTVMKALSYASAGEISGILRNRSGAVLSQRGTVQIDQRTNSLIIRELPQNIDTVLAVINELDTPEPQVSIEARIIETTKTFARSLGIQWGFDGSASAATGNTTGLEFPNNGTIDGGVGLLTGWRERFPLSHDGEHPQHVQPQHHSPSGGE